MSPIAILLLLVLVVLVVGAVHAPARQPATIIGAAIVAVLFVLLLMRVT